MPIKVFKAVSECIHSKSLPMLFRSLSNGDRLLCTLLASMINCETSAEPLMCSLPAGLGVLMPTFCEMAISTKERRQVNRSVCFFIFT